MQTLGEFGAVDAIGYDPSSGLLTPSALSTDLLRPGILAYRAPFDPGSQSMVLNSDQPNTALTVRRDLAAYNVDHGQGAFLVHYQNRVGSKGQVVALRTTPKWVTAISPTTVTLHHTITVTVTFSNTAGAVPTGKVVLHNSAWGSATKTATLSGGKASFTWTTTARGSFSLYLAYTGDGIYAAATTMHYGYRVV